ncbi:hypothetical protein [Paraflavitalea speifideaquila]|uniref:hypothetical protein n=1 Tax=Paraflavitalea speifideaquila TaxID=3076558 RepID=UPI0028E9C8C6|nr:hypothetical protein [Paraflavitalea speifideiaquila]
MGAPGFRQNFDDREQDVFVFQFNGRIGKFVIGKNKIPKVLNDSKVLISFAETNMENENIQTRISSFIITDEQGIQYKFSEREITDVLRYNNGIQVNNYRVLKGIEHGEYVIEK